MDKSSSLNNLTSKENKNKSALRPKEINSKLSEKGKKVLKKKVSMQEEEKKLEIQH